MSLPAVPRGLVRHLRSEVRFATVLPSESVLLPHAADHKLVFAMLDGLGLVDPLTGNVLGRWTAQMQQGDLYMLCPSLRGHTLSFDGGSHGEVWLDRFVIAPAVGCTPERTATYSRLPSQPTQNSPSRG